MSRQITWPLEATRFPHYAVDELWYREPRLMVPGQVPFGPVTMNEDNGLSRGLHGLFLGRDAGKPFLPNYATKGLGSEGAFDRALWPTALELSGTPQMKTSQRGAVLDTTNNAQGGCYAAADYDNTWWMPYDGVTIMCLFRHFSYMSSGGCAGPLRGRTNAGAPQYYALKLYNNECQFVTAWGATVYFTYTGYAASLNDWHLAICSASTITGMQYVMFDGRIHATYHAGMVGRSFSDQTTPTNILDGFRTCIGSIEGDRGFDGQIAMQAMWYDRALQPGEMRGLWYDPFQLFRPA